jgi:uncharacterized protein YeaO (DUF488 family)
VAIRIVQLGTPRLGDEGTRIGAVRHLPRGVRRADYANRNFFDVWLPELAPSARLLSWARSQAWTDRRWATFQRRYRAEMGKPPAQRLIGLLAALSSQGQFSLGCYCENEHRCHRTILRDLLAEAGADTRSSLPPAKPSAP